MTMALWGALAALGGRLPAQTPGASEPKFSHRIHLQAGMTCAACHATVASSTAAEDRNLPGEKDCLACHDGQRASRLPPGAAVRFTSGPRRVRFSHRAHAALPGIAGTLAAAIDRGEYLANGQELRPLLDTKDACAACHRGLGRADLATAAHLPRMADCLVCHDRIDPPGSCEHCHPDPVAKLKPASHRAGFLERHSDALAGIEKSGCRTCHGTRFQCQGCH